MSTIHIVGAGMAGLSTAVFAAAKGARVVVYEAAGQAGGRCRSYHDAALDCTIDNGNHLVLSGNRAVIEYLRAIGAANALAGPERAEFSFVDLKADERWTIRPNDGPLPWWVFDAERRVPGTTPVEYARLAELLIAGPAAAIEDIIPCQGPLWERLVRPLLLAALNTEPEKGSAVLAAAVLRETLAKGGQAYRPRIATPNLAAAFVEPALRTLTGRHAMLHLGQRLRRIIFDTRDVLALEFPENTVPVSPEDTVVLAVPPWVAADLVPELATPDEFRSIVNAHFRIAPPVRHPEVPHARASRLAALAPQHDARGASKDAPAMLGVIGGAAEWIFAFPDRVSVTVSAADAIVDKDREMLAQMLWSDVWRALKLSPMLPPWQIVKEKRATFAATPEQAARRPGAKTAWRNLFLAGDWTDTGLPATIESALRSGQKAAQLAAARVTV